MVYSVLFLKLCTILCMLHIAVAAAVMLVCCDWIQLLC